MTQLNAANMTDAIKIQESGHSLILQFVRPEVRNPLSVDVLEILAEILTWTSQRDGIDRVIFTGTDDVFASGADLREIARLNGENARGFAIRGQNLMDRIASLPQTTIAAIIGFCFGGALDLALACDMRIASPSATFCHPGAGIGIITGWGGTQRLPRLVGKTRALEMFFTASAIPADAALWMGLIDEISDDPLEVAINQENAVSV